MTADLYGDLEMEDLAEEVWDLPRLFCAGSSKREGNVPTAGGLPELPLSPQTLAM
jgi:hypothetical protein